jgi:hypothetical protein
MHVPFIEEARHLLSTLGIPLLSAEDELVMQLHRNCESFRLHLLEKETSEPRQPLLQRSFWDITPKYRFDVLVQEIPKVANKLAYAIGFSSVYLEHVAPSRLPYFPTAADHCFWYHIDFGIRLASSGWDRVALLLDLAFDLHTATKCSLPRVLKSIPKSVDPGIVQDQNFKNLKTFRDGRFFDLEAGAGKGARHETTHLLLPSTRYLFSLLDAHARGESVPPELGPIGQRDMLVEHHKQYLCGIQGVGRLVFAWWETGQKPAKPRPSLSLRLALGALSARLRQLGKRKNRNRV